MAIHTCWAKSLIYLGVKYIPEALTAIERKNHKQDCLEQVPGSPNIPVYEHQAPK